LGVNQVTKPSEEKIRKGEVSFKQGSLETDGGEEEKEWSNLGRVL